MIMGAGKMLHVLELQRATTAPDAAGTPVQAWAHLATLRAEILADDAGEAIRPGGGVNDSERRKFRVRYVAGVTLADRILFRGTVWNIKAVAEVGRRSRLDLTCEAGP